MKLFLDEKKVTRCRELSRLVVGNILPIIRGHSTFSIERSTLRLVGINNGKRMDEESPYYPWANIIIDQLREENLIGKGALFFIANACVQFNTDPLGVVEKLDKEKLKFSDIPIAKEDEIHKKGDELAIKALSCLVQSRKERNQLLKECKDPHDPNFQHTPLKYVIVASGNIFEDVVQACSAAQAGADVIAVIRSTAQSLLDYIPQGATTEGFGGTYATQENFRIMREALDKEGKKLNRYIRLTNYASGLCMPEISVLAAKERLDFLLCDSLYGILFRDINMKRTFIDQHFSRMICALSEIFINTGEDNYLTTADAVENGHQVLASNFINERFALEANMKKSFMGLGHAMEMNPWQKDVFLLEIARAQMTRDIFPEAPLKYMPPTRHMEGDIFFSHVYDAIFNLVGVTTKQGIQLLGMPTEAMHTPLLMDRFMSLKSANYIFQAAKSLGNEIEFRRGGKIHKWAEKVLDDTLLLLEEINKLGFLKAIEKKVFAGVSRTETSGKGFEGVFRRQKDYFNPILEKLESRDYEN